MKVLKVWTDGACFPNPGSGGWGWTTLAGESGSGSAHPTTNQIMELTATIKAIETLANTGAALLIISDSMYVIKGATIWSQTWVKNGWKNSKNQPVANRELWERLLALLKKSVVKFQWVKGHSGDLGNDEADRLATIASGATPEIIAQCSRRWHGDTETRAKAQ